MTDAETVSAHDTRVAQGKARIRTARALTKEAGIMLLEAARQAWQANATQADQLNRIARDAEGMHALLGVDNTLLPNQTPDDDSTLPKPLARDMTALSALDGVQATLDASMRLIVDTMRLARQAGDDCTQTELKHLYRQMSELQDTLDSEARTYSNCITGARKDSQKETDNDR